MTTITPDKNKLYIQFEYPISSGVIERIRKTVEKVNHNFEITMLIYGSIYQDSNTEIKTLLKRVLTKNQKSKTKIFTREQ